ncbi:MAG TPA: hypothetical protein VFZ04_00240, partial [Longimicrobiales bacterium]
MTGTRSTGNVEAGCARALKESPGACGVALGVAILTSPFEYVLAAFLTVAVGDGLAEPVGLWLGHRNRYMVPDPLFGGYNRKSVAGSMTLFVCALPIAAGTHSIQGVSAVNAILAGAAYGAVAMLIEAVSPRGLDNTLLLLLGPPVLAASGAALLSVGRARGTARGHDNFAAPACFDMATRTSERVSSRPDCSPSVLNLSRVGGTLGNYARFLMLLLLKGVATALFRSDAKGIDGGRIPGNPWDEVRLICFLNHTSLYEPLFAAAVPTRFMWQIACRSVVPIAEITLSRPILGRLLRLLIAHPVAISREPDETWQAVLKTITEHKDA